MEKPILDPAVPYTGPIYGGTFGPGRMVRIQGTVPAVAYRFDVNLQCGSESRPKDDIAVNLAIHILDGYICLNTLQNGIWGEEQRHLLLPIKRAERFEIILMCDYNQYKIAINGQHYCEFPQRVLYDRISHLTIDGDVSIIQITYESANIGDSSNDTIKKPEVDDFVMLEGINARPLPMAPTPLNNPPVLHNPAIPGSTSTGIPYVPPMYVGPPPPNGAPIPLNAASSNFRSVNRKYETRWYFCFGLGVIMAFGMFVLLLSGFLIR